MSVKLFIDSVKRKRLIMYLMWFNQMSVTVELFGFYALMCNIAYIHALNITPKLLNCSWRCMEWQLKGLRNSRAWRVLNAIMIVDTITIRKVRGNIEWEQKKKKKNSLFGVFHLLKDLWEKFLFSRHIFKWHKNGDTEKE